MMCLDVLIADQDAELAELYCRFLAVHGFLTDTAKTGLECLGKVHNLAPNVLVLDRELRWGDADGVLACLREDDLSISVILTSWNASPARARELVASPVVLCLRKFFTLPALLDGIRFAVDSNSSRDAFSAKVERIHQGEPTWSASK